MRTPNMERFRNQAVAVALCVPVSVGMVTLADTASSDPTDALPGVVAFLCTDGKHAAAFSDHIDDPARGAADRAVMNRWIDNHRDRHDCVRV